MPVYHDWHRIPALLAALQSQTLAQDAWEVLLVDNAPQPDQAGAILALPANTRVLHCAQPGSYAARNHGAAHANAAWLAFTDADCRPHRQWLETLQAAIAANSQSPGAPAPLLAGSIRMYPQAAEPSPYEIYDLIGGIRQDRYVRRGYAATANLTLAASTWKTLGGFDARRFSGGDADMCRRAVAHGHALHYLPEAVVYHPARRHWRELVQKSRRVKGGQICAGTRSRRCQWILRTLLPPVIAWWRFRHARAWPWHYRLTAMRLQYRLWFVDIQETLHLLTRKAPPQRA
ncbi:MAG: glycosyltransferase [Planctomycetota bacterium]|nr:MAG: glycosyltransferase [Planctomycetota bacterium]